MRHSLQLSLVTSLLLAVFDSGSLRGQVTAPTGLRVAIRDVTVIDVITGQRRPAQTVVIDGRRIARVGPTARTAIPRGARIIDGRGKYVAPGLWDMHIHMGERAATTLPLLLAHGVTGARDLHFGTRHASERAVALRDSVASGQRLGPRLVVGTIVAGAEPAHADSTLLLASSPDEGRAVVRAMKTQRLDFVKVRNGQDRATYFAILNEARRLGIPVDGHVSFSLSAAEASDSGQRTIEHVAESGALSGCTASDSAFRHDIRAAQQAPAGPRRRANVIAVFVRMSAAIDEESCLALGRRLARNGTAWTPTLVYERMVLDRFDAPPLAANERPYVPREMQRWYDGALAAIKRDTGEVWRRHFRQQVALVSLMKRAGVTILAGTDLGTLGFPTPGFGLHQELRLLADAGLTPLEVLQIATINPARALGMADSVGTVAPGKLADLLLLDADPLLELSNLQRVRAVVANGRYLNRRALDAMLLTVAHSLAAEPVPAERR